MPRREDYPLLSAEEFIAIVRQRLRAELASLLQSEVEAEIIEASIADLRARGQVEEAEERQRHVEERRARIAALRAHIEQKLAALERQPGNPRAGER
jgi:hypothetical protein